MTTPETLEETAVEEPVADELAEDDLSPEEQEQLSAALLRCGQEQPSVRALDLSQPIEWYGREGGLHFMSIGGHDGLFDPATALFTPLDPEPVRQLLIAALQDRHGAAEFDAGDGQTRTIDWPSLQTLSEGNGVLMASASSLPDAEGNVDELALRVDVDWDVTVEPLDATGLSDIATLFEEAMAAEAGTTTEGTDEAEATAGEEITGDYLASHYGDAAFPFDGRDFVLDWTTWSQDNTTADGLVGSYLDAHSDGARYRVYAWFGSDTGIQIVEAEPLDEGADAGGDEEAGHGITAEYLGEHYGDAPLEFDGQNYIVDWTKWEPDQVLDDGRVGSPVTGVGSDGADYDLYVWFDLENGAQIVEATPLEATPLEAGSEGEAGDGEGDDQGDEEEFDAQAHFDEVLVPQLRDRWSSDDNLLLDGSTKYDVSAWIDGDSDARLEFDSHDGDYFYATVTASTTDGDGSQRVRCSLRIENADNVVVESTETLS